jgi:thiol:disulfide interchange protein DsbD
VKRDFFPSFVPWCLVWIGCGWSGTAVAQYGPAGGLPAAPQEKAVTAELWVDDRATEPGAPFLAGVRLALADGWHLYWENPGSPGFPPKVEWALPAGYTAGALRFPVPHRFEAAGFVSYGYEGEAVFLAWITPPPGAGVPEAMEAEVTWLACQEQCVRDSARLSWKRGAGAGSGARLDAARKALPEAVEWPVAGAFDASARRVSFRIGDGGRIPTTDGAYFFPAPLGMIDSATAQAVRRDGEGLVVEMGAQAGFGGEFPERIGGIVVDGKGGAWRIGGDAAGDVAEPGPEPQGGQGWGYWLQRPSIVTALAAVMLLIALNLFGVFEVGGSLAGVGGGLAHREGLAGSFFSGALATLLATPCTAPAMGFAITFALGSSNAVAVLVFTLIGLGMATPYLLLSAFPGWLSRLPRPGAWMETFKQSMAFPMLLVVAWLLSVLARQLESGAFFFMLAALVLVALAAWVFGRFGSPARETRTRRAAWVATGALAVAAGWTVSRHADQIRPPQAVDVEAEIAALQAQGKSVFVDFTASWCVTCQANKPALHHESVERAFRERDVAFLEVDFTQEDPGILRVLQKHGRNGVPLYLWFPADAAAPPVELPNVLTPAVILAALDGGGGIPAAGEPGLWAAIGFAFLGGMILNLMPCVFPVITLKIMGFVSQAGEDRGRILRHGLAFTAGVLVFFWVLTALMLLAKAGLVT